MPLDPGVVTHDIEVMHRSDDENSDPIAEGMVLVADGDHGFTWEPFGGGTTDGVYTVEPQTPHQARHYLQRDGTWRDPFVVGLGTVDSVGSAVTITDDGSYNAWPTICRLSENRVITAYTKATTHHADNTGRAVIKIGTEDGDGTITWGSEVVVYDHASMWASAMGVARISTGRIFITLFRDTNGDADSGEAGVIYSDDDGVTWTDWIALSIGRDAEYGAGACVELPDGDLLIPVEGHDVAGDSPLDNDSFVIRSTDGGETWGSPVLVHDFDTDSIPCYESCLVLLDNDVLQIYHRTGASAGSTVKMQESTDFGATWGAMNDAWTGYGKANVIQDSTGVLWAVDRQTGTADVILFSSIDRGASWDAGTVITTAPTEMEYGCPLESLRTGRLIIVWGDQPSGSTSNSDIDYALVIVDVEEFSSGVTVEDDGTPLATAGTTLDFVGAGVVASGTGAEKTITISGAPAGAAGGDLSGTYPNPAVVDDSHSHTTATAPGGGIGPILISDSHSTPIVFADILLTEEEDDILYADL